MKQLVGALLLALSLAHAHVSRADDATYAAENLFKSGAAAYQRGDYSAAGVAFDEAARHAPRAETSYNAGLAWEAAGEPLRAANAFHTALTAGALPEKLERDARERLDRLAAPFALLDITGPAGTVVQMEGAFREALPSQRYVIPGTHELEIEYPRGERETRAIVLARGANSKLELHAPAAPPKRLPEAVTAPSRSWQLPLGVVALGVAGVSAGTGVALGARGLNARDRFDASGRTDADARNQALSLRTYADIAFGGALLFSGIGIVLLLDRPHADSASTRVGIGPGALSLERQF